MTVDELAALLIAELAGELSPTPDLCRVDGPVYVGSESTIFIGEGRLFPRKVAIKLCREPQAVDRTAGADARAEYDALVRLAAAMAGRADMSVPAPVAMIEPEGIVVSEWIEGRSLLALCRDRRVSTAVIEDGIARAGQWLHCFHGCHPLAPAAIDVDWLMSLMEAKLSLSGRLFRRWPVRNAIAALRRGMDCVGRIESPRSWTHGDFKPGNILIGKDRTTGIDFGTSYENSILLDIAYFLNHLEVILAHPASLRHFSRRRLVEAFRRGYGIPDEIQHLAEPWIRLAWLICVRASTTGRGAMARLYDHWCFDPLISRLATRVERQL